MAIITKGTAIYAFGTKDEVFGYYESYDVDHSADKVEIQDGQGDVKAVIFTNHKREVKVSFTPLEHANATAIVSCENMVGKVIQLTADTGDTNLVIIDSATVSRSKGKELTVTINGTVYPGITATADLPGA